MTCLCFYDEHVVIIRFIYGSFMCWHYSHAISHHSFHLNCVALSIVIDFFIRAHFYQFYLTCLRVYGSLFTRSEVHIEVECIVRLLERFTYNLFFRSYRGRLTLAVPTVLFIFRLASTVRQCKNNCLYTNSADFDL